MSLLVEVNNIDLNYESSGEYYDDFDGQDKIEKAFQDCAVVLITSKAGERTWAAKHNFQFGTCECCSKITFSEIKNITFYKIEGKSPL